MYEMNYASGVPAEQSGGDHGDILPEGGPMTTTADHRGHHPARGGFTLTEIAISLALTSIAVLTIFLLVPQGIRTQNQVRYKVLAAAKAMELMEAMHQPLPGKVNNSHSSDKEGVFPWDTAMAYKVFAPDLESYVETARSSAINPLPEAIAYRLDSDFDEIRRLLDAGGRVYYFVNKPPTGFYESTYVTAADTNWMSDSDKMLVGVVGEPQQNSILYHGSLKIGPYQEYYPTPPTHTWTMGFNQGPHQGYQYSDDIKTHFICYDALSRDGDIAEVFESSDTYRGEDGSRWHFGWKPFGKLANDANRHGTASLPPGADPSDPPGTAGSLFRELKRRAEAYAVAALWYANQTGLDTPTLLGLATAADAEGFARANADGDDWRKVLAMRYLAHAAAVLTSYHPDGFPAGGAPLGGDPRQSMTMGGTDYGNVAIALDNVRAWHEASVQMAVRHADRAGPYHWGAPRPLNRQVMMDHPLVQLDLWSPAITAQFEFRDTTTGSWVKNKYPAAYDPAMGDHWPPHVDNNVVTRRQWRACYPQAIDTPLTPFSYPGRVLDTDADGDLDQADRPVPTSAGGWQPALGPSSHFNLSAPFEPSQRCRQMVFWAVSWQDYEDYETHPSARIDASRYPIVAPRRKAYNDNGWKVELMDRMAWETPDESYPGNWIMRTDWQRVATVHNGLSTLTNSLHNPEYLQTFLLPKRQWDPVEMAFTGRFLREEAPIATNIDKFGNNSTSGYGLAQTSDVWMPEEWNQYAGIGDTAGEVLAGHEPRLWNPMVLLGKYGVNRDGHVTRNLGDPGSELPRSADASPYGTGKPFSWGAIDEGTVPTSVRMRATTVARINFYDPRITAGLFQ